VLAAAPVAEKNGAGEEGEKGRGGKEEIVLVLAVSTPFAFEHP